MKFFGRVEQRKKTKISRIVNANEVFEALARGFSRYKLMQNQMSI